MKTAGKRQLGRGILASSIGIACNLLLSAAKIAIGSMCGLVSVVTDGFNNLSDCGSGIVSLVSLYVSEKPADKEHPYGHRRAEYIAAMATGFSVLFMAAELVRESIGKMIEGSPAKYSWVIYLVLWISVAVKAGMFLFYRIMAKRLDSAALKAAATDSLCDCAATTAVIAGIAVSQFTGFTADGPAGILVALFIAWQGIKLLFDASSKLLGNPPDRELTAKLTQCILEKSGVLGMHDLHVYNYGKGACFATVHIEMDARLPSAEAHAVIDGIEQDAKQFGLSLTAHLDPIDLQDKKARELEKKVRAAAEKFAFEIHDFRLVRGATDKAIFDVGVPFSCKKSDEDIRAEMEELLMSFGIDKAIITIDRE